MRPQKAKEPKPKPSEGPEKKSNDFIKYSGLGMQIFLTIGICGWLGYKMDDWWREGRPLFVILMVFIGMIGAFYQLYKVTKE